MCSVVGYISETFCKKSVLEGLSRLEYRGYDSAGFATLCPQTNAILVRKAAGSLAHLIQKLEQDSIDGYVGIGHTRWATHGKATELNAHPHLDTRGRVAVVHNGVIENFQELKAQLIARGDTFYSDTDTELVSHLISYALDEHPTVRAALCAVAQQLEGAYALVAMVQDHPDSLLIFRRRSPLCIGKAKDLMCVVSDQLACAGMIDELLFVPDNTIGIIKKDRVELFDFKGDSVDAVFKPSVLEWQDDGKQGHPHFMLKEIYEQKQVIAKTAASLQKLSQAGEFWPQLGLSLDQVTNLNTINFIACGTSYHAALIARYFCNEIANVPVSAHLASEFRYQMFFPEEKSIYIAISQSGETADSLEALRMIKEQGLRTATITNVETSSMVREAGGYMLTHAGREIAVASTKAFSTQLAALYWLAHELAIAKGLKSPAVRDEVYANLYAVSQILEHMIDQYRDDIVQRIAPKYAQYATALFLGRHESYPFACEAALKLKELAYIFAQAYPAGELKHGPLALVDQHIPVFIFSHQDPIIYQKLLINVQEVKARGGQIIAFAFEGQDELIGLADELFIIPPVAPLLEPLAYCGLMQFLVYQIALVRGCTIDKPRNLAKSVTVE